MCLPGWTWPLPPDGDLRNVSWQWNCQRTWVPTSADQSKCISFWRAENFKDRKKVQSVRSIRCCSTWQLHDEQHEQSPGRPTAYLFSQTAQVYTSSVRCRNSTDEGRVKSIVLYLYTHTGHNAINWIIKGCSAVAVSKVTLQFKTAGAADCRQ